MTNRTNENGPCLLASSAALHAYWSELRADREAPYRSEVDPRAIAPHLENTFILEDLGDGNIRIRLAGAKLCDMFGMELRGVSVFAFMADPSRADLASAVREALDGPSAVALSVSAQMPGEVPVACELLLLPMRSDFGEMTRVLGALNRFEEPSSGISGPRQLSVTGRRSVRSGTGAERAGFEHQGALPGFAESTPVFTGPPALRPIEGGRRQGERRAGGDRRRGHLRIVED